GYAVVAFVGADFAGRFDFSNVPFGPFAPVEVSFALDYLIFGLSGIAGLGIFSALAARVCRLPGIDLPLSIRWRAQRVEWFLVLWLALELIGYFFLTPFPAVRRLLGVVLVAALLAGHLASRTCRAPQRAVLIPFIVAYGIVLGFGFWAVDLLEAQTEK